MRINRRAVLAAVGGTLPLAMGLRKPRAETLAPPARHLQPVSPPQDAPDAPFVGQDGSQHHLADFRGRGMVVNLWATWCAPCVAEMPSLAALSKALAPSDIAVLPLSSDHGGAAAVAAWFQTHGVSGLPVLLDPKSVMARALGVQGIPTTVIIDKAGKIVARLEGAADWADAGSQALVQRLAGQA